MGKEKRNIDLAIILILTGNYLTLLSKLLRKGGEDLRLKLADP